MTSRFENDNIYKQVTMDNNINLRKRERKMKRIELTQGKHTIVDDDDFEELDRYSWQYVNGYAIRTTLKSEGGKKRKIGMHRQIMQTPAGMDTDHITGDKLDNRKSNLRICTRSQNKGNMHKFFNNTSGYKGVSLHKPTNKWIAQICMNKTHKFLGYFDSPEEAHAVYKKASLDQHGEFSIYHRED